MTTRNPALIGILVCLMALILICGCTQQPAAPVQTPVATAPPTPETTAGMPNPASVYCEQVGGTLEIMKLLEHLPRVRRNIAYDHRNGLF